MPRLATEAEKETIVHSYRSAHSLLKELMKNPNHWYYVYPEEFPEAGTSYGYHTSFPKGKPEQGIEIEVYRPVNDPEGGIFMRAACMTY
jgi:hypothetical protein